MPKSSKKGKKKNLRDTENGDDGNIQDERFAKAQTHPQFQKLHTKRNKKDINDKDGNLISSSIPGEGMEEIDDRFKAVLTDSRFAMGGDVGAGIDKYGRKTKKSKKKDKKTEEEEEEDPATSGTENSDDSGTDSDSSSDDNDDDKNDEEEEDPQSRIAYLKALSRGEIDVSSSSDEDSSGEEEADSSSDDDSVGSEDSLYGTAGVLDPSKKQELLDAEPEITFEESKFLAACNMDWESVRALDLFAITSSFAPPGSIRRVSVYPSDFGMERLEKDATLGPQGIWKKNRKPSNQEEDEQSNYSEESDSEEENEDKDKLQNSDHHEDSDHHSDDESEEEKEEEDYYENNSEEDEVDIDEEELLRETYKHFDSNPDDGPGDSDFDAEKLRAYEASKMKYYFAVIEFTTSEAADAVYKEVDGMEIGHSSSVIDLRSIPEADVEDVVKDRQLRDQATVIPSNYTPPDFVVAALQQTNVKCTWEEGDKERERVLTQYGVGNSAWQAMTDGDDLRAYLASDGSSDEDSDEEGGREEKAKNMRALLGLGGSDDDDEDVSKSSSIDDAGEDDDSFFASANLESDGEDEDGGEKDGTKEISFIPGKSSLEEKIRSKLNEKDGEVEELTPWEKYLEKRKEKRKEKKRQKKQQKVNFRGENGVDPFAVSTKKTQTKKASTKEELDLLLAGDEDEEAAKDFHMRDIVRIEKNKSKKLKGSRKRKEAEIRDNAVGLDFQIDTKDDRFAAVIDGSDDRFGIDRTDPQFKETPAMRQLLAEQTKRRKSKKRARKAANTDVDAEAIMSGGVESSGAMALSSLVKNLKTKVAKTS